MAYANLASITKKNRASQIVTSIGSGAFMNFYIGAIPASPDFPPPFNLVAGDSLIASLPLSNPPAVASLAILSGSITAAGIGGTDGTYALTITPAMSDPGVGAAGVYTVLGGILSSIQMSNNGSGYVVPPTFSGFATSGLTGATASPVMTGILVFNTIASAVGVGTGTAGFVRIVTSGGVGIIDLDIGTTNGFSVITNSTFIGLGGEVSCTADVLIEG